MKKINNILIWLFILLWVAFYQVYWQLDPHLSQYSDQSWHTVAYLIMKGLSAIGPVLLVMLLGYFLRNIRDREGFLIKVWLNTLVLGLLVCLIVAFSSNKLTTFSTDFFNALFPIIRNTYSLIVGPSFGLILVSFVDKLNEEWQKRAIWTAWLLIIISFFHYPNNWGWEDGQLVLFYAVVFLLGTRLKRELSTKKLVTVSLACSFLLLCLQCMIGTIAINREGILHFSTPTNLLTVIVTYCIAALVIKFITQIKVGPIFTYLVLIENTGVIALIQLSLPTQSTTKVGVHTFLFSMVGLIVAVIWIYLIRKVRHQFDKRLSSFTGKTGKEQLVDLKKLGKKVLPTLALVIASYLIAALSQLLMNNSFSISPNVDATYNIFSYTFETRELVIIFTAVLTFATIKFFQAVTKRYWVGLLLVVIINVVIVIANQQKIAARNEPILPSDLLMASVAKELFGMVSGYVWLAALVGLILVVALMIYLEKKYPIVEWWSVRKRIVYILLAPLLLSTSLFWNHQGNLINNFMTSIGDQPMFYNQLSGARVNGPVVQFLNNVDVTVMEKPSGYSKATMQRIVSRYKLEAKEINKTRTNNLSSQTIIFNLSESFANPNRVPGVKLKNNPVPYITKMAKNNTGGLMISSGYGGGTANMEYMALTGLSLSNFSPTLPTPYTQLVTSLKTHPSIVDYFNYAVSIHPYSGIFYNRIQVYKKFGFNKFLYLGGKDPIRHQSKIERSPYISDNSSYQNVLDQLKRRSGGQFINLISMQNHFPYDRHYYNTIQKYAVTKVSVGTNADSVNEFTAGIHYTDEAMKDFIQQIDKINKPITIVFYGDHLPGIYGNSMAKDGLRLHETDYFIYSNAYARRHGATNYSQVTKYVSPNDFIAMVAKQTNSKVNWYQALLTRVFEELPAMGEGLTSTSSVNTYNNSTQFVNQKGQIVKESKLTKKQKQLLHDYRLVQYDITAGKHYISNQTK